MGRIKVIFLFCMVALIVWAVFAFGYEERPVACNADIDRDGDVDIQDFIIFRDVFQGQFPLECNDIYIREQWRDDYAAWNTAFVQWQEDHAAWLRDYAVYQEKFKVTK